MSEHNNDEKEPITDEMIDAVVKQQEIILNKDKLGCDGFDSEKAFVSTHKRMDELIQVVTELKDRVWEQDISVRNGLNGYAEILAQIKDELSYLKAYTKTLESKYEELHTEIGEVKGMIRALN